MKLPDGMKPALFGAVLGAIAVSIIGFNWGGWVTGSSATEMSNEDSTAAVALALTPYCVLKSKNDPKSGVVMAELADANDWKRRSIVEDAGWATPLGTENPHRALADSCQSALSNDT
ncbi:MULTISPECIES: hypothetical protein [Roseobacteraceae]|jgi:alpha/beta superfamily hydrolase|uniref:Uncharacterized protein n=1 Tax=Pseudosulfitobacter pseudonitzschiae TaxID=1402135 RepID=A0A221K4G3_9RHOB|nr:MULTISPECIES: hypothetical protein [Roseobacteraceae]ASM73727.1 hypothetical protein SULPSESMR1_02946 [Pseudosulfitobacter pseudonitzschiae]